MNKSAIIEIANALGQDAICERLDVKPRSLRLARERGVFPASWYEAISAMCRARGIACPLDAFNWKNSSFHAVAAPNTPHAEETNGHATANIQDGDAA